MWLYDDHVDPFANPVPPLRRFDDAKTPYEVLNATVPLGTRWPEWRTLDQTEVFLAPGLPALAIDDLCQVPGLMEASNCR